MGLASGRLHREVIEDFTQRGRGADAQLGMALAEVFGHRRRVPVPNAIHEEEAHPAAETHNLESSAAVEHEFTPLAPRVTKVDRSRCVGRFGRR